MQRDDLIVPASVAGAGDRQSSLHVRGAGIVGEFPGRAGQGVIPHDANRDGFGCAVREEFFVELEIQGVLARGVLEATGESRVDRGGRGDGSADAPPWDRRGVGVDLVEEARVVVGPDLPADVVEALLLAALSDLSDGQGFLVVRAGAIRGELRADLPMAD